MQNQSPKIINGTCEFCGIPACQCPHYEGKVDQEGFYLPVRKGKEIVSEVVEEKPIPIIVSKKQYSKNNEKLADIIIPHHNRHDMLERLLCLIDLSLFNVIVVAGNSFGKNCNKGAKLAETNNLIFLNDDIIISNEHLIKIVNSLQNYDIVGSTQIAGISKKIKYWGIGLFENANKTIRHQISTTEDNSIFPSGFCFGITKKKWKLLKGFNEKFKTGNEDVDFGLRAMELEMKTRILDLEIIHNESQSDGRFEFVQENEDLIYSIWGDKLIDFYNKKHNK